MCCGLFTKVAQKSCLRDFTNLYILLKKIHDIKSQVCAAVPFSIHHFIKRFCGPTFYKGVLLKKIYNFVFHRRNKVIEVLKNLRVSKL